MSSRQLHLFLRAIVVILVVTALTLAVFYFHDRLSFRDLGMRKSEFLELDRRYPTLVIFAFMAIQIVSLCLCVPGAVFSFALVGGAVFGSLAGTVIVLCSVTIGDTLSFLTARFVLRNWVQRRFGRQLSSVEKGISADGAYYLLGLRLLPILPFFLVNLTMGVTRMPLRIFAPISFIGLAPSVALYVNAGTRISEIKSRADVLSPGVLLIFALLASFPVLTHLAWKASHRRTRLSQE